jgi:hypothetical protein
MVKRIDWMPSGISSTNCLATRFTGVFEDEVSTPVERLAQHPAKLRKISPDPCLDFASDARLIDDVVGEGEWVYRLRSGTGGTMRLKFAALAALSLLCLICTGCPDESQQQSSTSRSTHPGSVAVAEYSSAPSELGCAGGAILVAFLRKRKEAGRNA